MSNVVIDLGEVRAAPPADAPASRPPFPYRAVLATLTVVLLALLAGGAHRHQTRPVIIPARLGDLTFLAGDRMFVVSAGAELRGTAVRNQVISTYAMPEGTLLTQTTVVVSGSVTGVIPGGDEIVLSYRVNEGDAETVVALDAGSDRSLWRRLARLSGVSATAGLVLLNSDEAAFGVDLATGVVRWTAPRPANGYFTEAGYVDQFPRWIVAVTDSGQLTVRDARTGRIVGERALPRSPRRENRLVWPVGDVILADTGAGFTAYSLPDLTPRWRTAADLTRSWLPPDCGTVICAMRPREGMSVLDPANGRELWSSDRWAYAEPVGDYLVATLDDRTGQQPSLWVLEATTGRMLGSFGGWQGLGPARTAGQIYGKYDVRGRNVIRYGVLDPATHTVRVLGSADRVSGGCETSPGVLVCRLVDASIAVWRLG